MPWRAYAAVYKRSWVNMLEYGEAFGQVIRWDPYEAKIDMPATATPERIAALIAKFPVRDIDIRAVTLEEVAADLFKTKG